MTDFFIELIPQYGLWLIAVTTFLSCLALPVPASLMMLTAGGFVAAGDLNLAATLAAAYGGALAGDQAGFAIGRRGGAALLGRLKARPRRAALVDRAEALMARRGALGIFLSRWLFAPIGPWLNFAAGAARLGWPRFTASGAAGEALWVGLYVGAGHLFAGNLAAASDLLGSALGFLAAGAVTLGLGLWLRMAAKRGHRAHLPHRHRKA